VRKVPAVRGRSCRGLSIGKPASARRHLRRAFRGQAAGELARSGAEHLSCEARNCPDYRMTALRAKSGPSLIIIVYIRNISDSRPRKRATLDDGNESSDDFPCSGTLASRSSPIPIGKLSFSMRSENLGMARKIVTVIPSTLDLILITLQRHAIRRPGCRVQHYGPIDE
jgi:hypothetical protein